MASAKVRAAAIRALEDKFGRVTAAALVEEARNPKHALHKEFPWSDKVAAHQHRLDIARSIISSVRVTINNGAAKISTVAYVRNPILKPREPGYISVARLRDEREAAADTLQAEMDRVQSLIERCRELAAALELTDDFDALLLAATSLRSRIRRGSAVADEVRPQA